MRRNQYLEMDGLFWESDTHEWFNDKSTTDYAHRKDLNGISLTNLYAFVVRDKETGEYDRVLMDKSLGESGEIIYDTTSLEDIGSQIDKIRVLKHFK